jgi:hypothetical protein
MREPRKRRTWRRLPLLAVLALAAAAALVVAGCGGSGGSETSGASSSASATTGGEGAQGGPGGFAEISDEDRECLKEQGVELPEAGAGGGAPEGGEMPSGEPPEGFEPPEGGGEGGPPGIGGEGGEEMKEAFEACGVELGQGGSGGGASTNSAAFKKQVKEYVACVREDGYELPEPDFSGEGPVFDESEVDRESAAFKKASEACGDLLSKPSGGAQETSGSGT